MALVEKPEDRKPKAPDKLPVRLVFELASVLPAEMADWEPYVRLPKGVVRDLLAVTRMLYRQTVEQDPRDVVRLQALTDIGKAYHKALRLCANPEHRGTIRSADVA